MNLWYLNYELFLMGNNKILMKSITVSPSFMFRLFSVTSLSRGSCLAFGVADVDFENLWTSNKSKKGQWKLDFKFPLTPRDVDSISNGN